MSRGSVWVYTTMRCNFRCSYCIQSEVYDRSDTMDIDTASACVQWIDRRFQTTQSLSVAFFGGEPLLTMDVISYICANLSGRSGRNVDFSVVTNGYLLSPEITERLVKLGVSTFQITVDGPSSVHDMRRRLANGNGTHDVILKNLKALIEKTDEITILIKVNVDKQNAAFITELLDSLSTVAKDPRVHLVVGPVIRCLDPREHDRYLMNDEEFLDVFLEVARIAGENGYSLQLMDDQCGCNVSCENSVYIGSDGTIFKCPSLVGVRKFSVGHVKSGFLFPQYYESILAQIDEDCFDCPYVRFCRGGCSFRELTLYGIYRRRKVCRRSYYQRLVEGYYELMWRQRGR